MPDQVVILFMFAIVTSFGIIWVANEMRLKFQARYLEYCFYFALVTVAYGFVNWIVPFIVLYWRAEPTRCGPSSCLFCSEHHSC